MTVVQALNRHLLKYSNFRIFSQPFTLAPLLRTV